MIKMRIITKVAGTMFKKANTNLEFQKRGKTKHLGFSGIKYVILGLLITVGTPKDKRYSTTP